MEDKKNTVLLTGISGWIAQFCAIELIKQGYYVRGSLRSLNKQSEVINELNLAVDTSNKLEFCKLDLLNDTGWDEAMTGCTYVLHLASPFTMTIPKHENDLITPAKEGALRALKTAKKAGVKRLVLTSSFAAMAAHIKEGSFNPSSWTDLTDTNINAYQKSKTIAEKAAWEFIHNQGTTAPLEMTVINPGAVFGPTLGNNIKGESLSICAQLLTGKMPGIPNINTVMVDVRDVAKHHVQAMIHPDANGKRFISAHATPTPFLELAQTLQQHGYKVTTRKVPTFILKIMSLFDRQIKGMLPVTDRIVNCDNSDTINTFNWTPIPLKKTFVDMAASVQKVLNKS